MDPDLMPYMTLNNNNDNNSMLINLMLMEQMNKDHADRVNGANAPSGTGGGGMPMGGLNPYLFLGEGSPLAGGGAGAAGGAGAGGTSAGAAGAGGAGAGAGATGAGGLGALGWAGLIAAGVIAGKETEQTQSQNPIGRGLLSALGPSIPQMKEDPKLALTTALGVPFINGAIRSDKSASAAPEWRSLFG